MPKIATFATKHSVFLPTMEIAIILLLIILNGLFALCEISLVSSKRARLESEKKNGSRNAAIALELLEKPDHFLSTMQIGITVIGIIAGAYGGATLSNRFEAWLLEFQVPFLMANAHVIAWVLVISSITYLSIVVGELVPKTIALNHPEPIALAVAPLVKYFTKATYPIVIFLSFSTKMILKVFFIDIKNEQSISEDELVLMVKMADQQGAEISCR